MGKDEVCTRCNQPLFLPFCREEEGTGYYHEGCKELAIPKPSNVKYKLYGEFNLKEKDRYLVISPKQRSYKSIKEFELWEEKKQEMLEYEKGNPNTWRWALDTTPEIRAAKGTYQAAVLDVNDALLDVRHAIKAEGVKLFNYLKNRCGIK